MTPETKRIICELRSEFYSLFAAAMNVPVNISGASYSSNSPIASWIDKRQRLNYLNMYAHTAPDEFVPQRPFLLRVAINNSAGRVTFIKQKLECKGLNQEWNFALTLLPEEVMDFIPWIVNLVKTSDKGFPEFLLEPPHPFGCRNSNLVLSQDVWTQAAWQAAQAVVL